MRRSVMMLAAAGCILAACGAGGDLSSDDEAAIRAASADWVAAYNENDWTRLADLFTEDAVMMPPGSSSVQGRRAIADWERENEDGFRIAFAIDEIGGGGDAAYVRGRSCVFIPDGRGRYGVDVGKFLEVRERQRDGRWLIAYDAFNSDLPPNGELAVECPFAERPM